MKPIPEFVYSTLYFSMEETVVADQMKSKKNVFVKDTELLVV